jgi:hypothetical protein
MKYILFVLFVATVTLSFAQNPQVKHVITHNRSTIICDPKTASNPYDGWGVFPSVNVPIRKITMKVTLGSPDSINTAHWDYLDHILIRRKGGMNGERINYELGRMLTPYGSIYNKGWSWTWQTDVTDFASFLRDSTEIEYIHSGYEANNVGWALTIDFEITLGPPILNFLGITTLWNKGYKYGDSLVKIENNLLPVFYQSTKGTEINRIRMQHTGHGMDKPRGCSEFCERWRDLKLDNQLVDHRNMWKNCGNNPLYPQGGTWVYDRAYWCPGDLQEPDIIDVFVKPGQHQISCEMQPYTATDNIQAVEDISAYLFHYSKPLKKYDAAIDKILVPNKEQRFSRLNPASFNPRFTIRNLGSENLHSVIITYGTDGFPKQVYHWKGDLKFNQTAEIIIPEEIQMKEGKNTYTVTLSKPNGKTDAWAGDNEQTTTFFSPVNLPTQFIIQLKTNNRPTDNEVALVNANSGTLFSIKPKGSDTNTFFVDTLNLKEGLYELALTDSAGDGLEFWAEPQNGDGYLRLFDMKGNLIHNFESDCGDGEKLAFRASSTYVTDTTQAQYAFSLYPRLVTDNTELDVVSNKTGNMRVEITVDGKIWETHAYQNIKKGTYAYNLSNLPYGRIVLEVFMDGKSEFKGRLNKRRKGNRF